MRRALLVVAVMVCGCGGVETTGTPEEVREVHRANGGCPNSGGGGPPELMADFPRVIKRSQKATFTAVATTSGGCQITKPCCYPTWDRCVDDYYEVRDIGRIDVTEGYPRSPNYLATCSPPLYSQTWTCVNSTYLSLGTHGVYGYVTANPTQCNIQPVDKEYYFGDITVIPDDDSPNDGPPEPCEGIGEPVNVMTGNVYFTVPVFARPTGVTPLTLRLSYNSRDVSYTATGMFGLGFKTEWEEAYSTVATGVTKYASGNGRGFYLASTGGVFAPLNKRWNASVTASGSETLLALPDAVRHFDTATGRLASTEDRWGNRLTVARDANNRVATVTDAFGRALTFVYPGTSQRVSEVKDPSGASIATFTYSGDLLTAVVFADGRRETFVYDGYARIATRTNALGKVVERHTYEQSSWGRALTSEIEGGAEKYTLAYSTGSTKVTDGLGREATYTYRSLGEVKRVTQVQGTCACGPRLKRDYDKYDRTLWTEDAAGHRTTFGWTESDLTSVTDALGNVVRREYAGGRLTAVVDQLNNRLTFARNAQGDITSIVDPTGATVLTTTYTASGLPATVKYANTTKTWAYEWTSGDLTKVTDPTSKYVASTYDVRGRHLSFTIPAGAYALAYNDATRQETLTLPGKQVYTVTKDLAGRVATIVSPAGTEAWAYDGAGRIASYTTAAGQAVTFEYDLMSNHTATVQDGLRWETKYDDFNRPVEAKWPDGRKEAMVWSDDDLLASLTQRDGTVVTNAWDAAHRQTTAGDATWAYDARGLPLSAANGADTLKWTYDSMGRATSEESTRLGSLLAREYAANGAQTALKVNGAAVASFAQDDAGRPTSETWFGKTFARAWDTSGRAGAVTYPNGVITTPTRNANSQLTKVLAKKGTTTLFSATYTLNSGGRRTAKALSDAAYSETYTLDADNRLKSVKRGTTLVGSFAFDARNNLSAVVGGAATYDSSNRILTYPGLTFQHDALGNLTRKSNGVDVWDYGWQASGLATAKRNGVSAASFVYDPLGRKIERTVSGAVTTCVHDGRRCLVEQSGATTTRYVTGEAPWATESGGAWKFFTTDGLGSVAKVTDLNGAVVQTRQYNAFGKPEVVTTSGLAFAGQTYVAEIGLSDFPARFYDPETGRFLSEDPAGFGPGSINLYNYTGNGPHDRIDQTGEFWWLVGLGAAAGGWYLWGDDIVKYCSGTTIHGDTPMERLRDLDRIGRGLAPKLAAGLTGAALTKFGKAFETHVGITGPKTGFWINGRRRFPDDALWAPCVREAKCWKHLPWRRDLADQFKDEADIAKAMGKPFQLDIPAASTIDPKMQGFLDSLGAIIKRW